MFRVLTAPLAADGVVTDVDRFVDYLERREQQITMEVEPGIAFPHARSTAVRSLCLTVGIADAPGVEYSSGGESRVRLFFLIGVPAFAPTAHLPLLQRLAVFARDPARTDRLLAYKTPGQVAAALARFKFKPRA